MLRAFRLPTDGVKRPIHMIASEEIELAILYLVEEQFGMLRDKIPQSVIELFGFERARAEAVDIMRAVVDDLVERGTLRSSGHQVYLT